MPDACGPRNEGQLPLAVSRGRAGGVAFAVLVIFLMGLLTTSPAGDHALRSMIICRILQSSETRSNLTCFPSLSNRYLPGPSQPPGPPLVNSSTSEPSLFHVPLSVGQPFPSILNVPAG